MKSSRLVILVLVALLLAPLGPVATAQDQVTITMWTEEGDEVQDLIAKLAEPFNAANPGIHVEIVEQESLNDVLRTAIQAGEAPDIIQTPGASFIAEYVAADLIVPLTHYADQYGWKDKLLPWAYDSGVLNGELYSIPITYESMILLYNKTLFEENGWVPPTNLVELEMLAAEMIDAGINPFAYGNSDWQPASEHLIGIYLNNYAGPENVYQALVGEKSWSDPVFVEAINLLKTHMADNDWFSGGLDYYYQNIWDDWWVELANADAGMVMSGSWTFCCATDFFDEAGQEWDWAPLPMFNDAAGEYNYELATGSTVSLNRFSDHPDEAALFLDFWLSDPARVLDIASSAGFGEYLVPLHFAVEDFPEGTDDRVARFFADFAAVTGEGRFGYTTWTFWPADPNVQLWTDIEGVWAGDYSVEEYLEYHQELWEGAREEGGVLNIPAP